MRNRLPASVDFLKALAGRLLEHASDAPRSHGQTPRIAGGTSLTLPDSKGTDFRVHGVYDFGAGGFTPVEVSDRRELTGAGHSVPR